MELRTGTPEEAGMSPERIRRVAALAKGWVGQRITPSLVVLVARRGVIVLHEAYGCLTPEQDSPPLQRDTIYPLASITKPITATAAMILVEDGLLGLNRPVAEYLPEFTGEGKQAVMVHHLLTHTSGLQQEEVDAHAEKKQGTIEIPPPEENQYPPIHEALLLRYDAPLWKPPGTEMAYCNYGYLLLGEIIRRVSGQALAQFAHERIFAPLGMNDTFYIVPDSVRDRIVRRPADAPGAEMLNSRVVQETPGPAGGVFSTALDMAIFGQMFLNGGSYGDARILGPATIAAITRNQIPGVGARFEEEVFPEAAWGLGWSLQEKKKDYIGTLHSPRTFSHGGAGGVLLWIDPVYEIVGVYFSVRMEKWTGDHFIDAVTAACV
jgi:CubicO group peptidase (beta-lactamase class C family)